MEGLSAGSQAPSCPRGSHTTYPMPGVPLGSGSPPHCGIDLWRSNSGKGVKGLELRSSSRSRGARGLPAGSYSSLSARLQQQYHLLEKAMSR